MDNVHDFALRMALVEEPDHFPCGSIGQPVTDHNYIDGVWIVRRLQRLFFRRDGNHFVAGGFQGPLAQERQLLVRSEDKNFHRGSSLPVLKSSLRRISKPTKVGSAISDGSNAALHRRYCCEPIKFRSTATSDSMAVFRLGSMSGAKNGEWFDGR